MVLRGVRTAILIAGAGPAGCAVALEALAHGFSVALCDATRISQPAHLGEIFQSQAKFPGLVEAGAILANGRHHRDSESFVHWGRPGMGLTSNHSVEASEAPWHLDKQAFTSALQNEVASRGGLVLLGTRVIGVERAGDAWLVRTSRGAIESSFLVDATGRVAAIACKLGARRLGVDRLTATTISLPAKPRVQRMIEAMENGWWYCASHPTLGIAATYFTDNDLRCDVASALEQSRFTKIFVAGKNAASAFCPRVLAAHTSLLLPVAGQGWCAVGDAAFSCDPLSSSGIENAFRSAEWAIEAVRCGSTDAYARQISQDFERYLQERQRVYSAANRHGEFWRRRVV